MMDLALLEDTPPWDWPEDAGRTLAAALLDPHAEPEVRLLAAELAGSIVAMDDSVAGALLTTTQDDGAPEIVRGQAAIALGPVLELASMDGFDDPEDVPISESTFHRITDTLRILYRDPDVPKEVRRRILEASVRAPCDWHKDAVRAAYYSDDEAWRLTAVFAMRFVASFDEQILEALGTPSEEMLYEAIRAAGTWEVATAWPRVRSLLRSTETSLPLLLASIEAAGSIGGEEGLEMLQELSTSRDREIADAADEALLFSDTSTDWSGFGWEDDEDTEAEEEEP
jgi:hypothetical protein